MSRPFSVYLRENNKEFIEIEGDGNCLFRAFAERIYGNQDRWLEIKQREIDAFLAQGSKPFSPELRDELRADTSAAYIRAGNNFATVGYNGTDTDAYILAKLFRLRLVFVHVERFQKGSMNQLQVAQRVVTYEDRVAENAALNDYFGFDASVDFAVLRQQIFIAYSTGHYDLIKDAVARAGPERRLVFAVSTRDVEDLCRDKGACIARARARFGDRIRTYEDSLLFNIFDSQF